MASTEEAISYMGLKRDGGLRIMIFAKFGPEQYACAIMFLKMDNEFSMGIYDNNATARWHSECKFLVYPLELFPLIHAP